MEKSYVSRLLNARSFAEELLRKTIEKSKASHALIVLKNQKSGKFYTYLSVGNGKPPKEDTWKPVFDRCTNENRSLEEKTPDGIIFGHPLRFSVKNVIGCLLIVKRDGEFSDKDREKISRRALLISLAVNNQILEDILNENWKLMEILTKFMDVFKEKQGEGKFLETILRNITTFFKADTAMVTKLLEGRNKLKIIACKGIKPAKDTIDLNEGVSGEAATTKQPVIFEDYPLEKLPKACIEKGCHMGSAIAIPIFIDNKLYGTLSLCRNVNQPKFTLGELGTLTYLQSILNFVFSIHEYEREKEMFNKISFRAQKLEALGILAGGIAHDFNNIINVILGFAQVCIERARENPELVDYLNVIIDECKKAASLISQILYFSREDTGGEKKVLDLKPLIKEFTKLISRTLPENINVSYSDDGNSHYYVSGSPESLHAALMNIATNAKDAMPNGGQLHITLKKESFDLQPLLSPYPNPAVVVEISDTGCGIPEEYLDKIFDPFFTTKGDRGTGLGLYQTFNIVKSMGGTIDVESKVNRGTTFRIFLPEATPTTGEVVSIDTSPPMYPELDVKGKVLVVEDNEPLLAAVIEMLSGLSIAADGFTKAEDAIRHFENNKGDYEILITDIVMPKVDGLTLADRLKLIKPDLKIIYTTGYTDKAQEVFSRTQEKSCILLLKPFTIFDLANAIQRIS